MNIKFLVSCFTLVSSLVAFTIAARAELSPKEEDLARVKAYICAAAGNKTIEAIKAKEGGKEFCDAFFGDVDWMEEFAGSGPWGSNAAKSLEALDLLYWNDEKPYKGSKRFIETKLGRNIATALALNHAHDFDDEKLVGIFAAYRQWAEDGMLDDSAQSLDTRKWREVLTFGQNAPLDLENLLWIHDFANVKADRYGAICWECVYRLHNCFGDSVQGPMYYKPWEHRWNTQELRYRVGGVCGALSKFGSHSAASHGIRSFTAGQPSHCAYMLWDAQKNRWGISYSVTGRTGSHFSLGAPYCFTANEEQDRYFNDPNRMKAERYRWEGKYEEAMREVDGNWQAADEWLQLLKARNATKEEWSTFAAILRATFSTAPYQGWQLYYQYLDQVKPEDKIREAKKGFLAFKENPAESFEPLLFDVKILDELTKRLGGGEERIWQMLPAILEGQAKSKNFFRQSVNWAAGKLMTSPENCARFINMVGKIASEFGAELDFKGMIVKASSKIDLDMWRQVHSLMDRISPESRTPQGGKSWPREIGGKPILSEDGMLVISTTSTWDTPLRYRDALEATGRGGNNNNSFHTNKEDAPWAMVALPGPAEISDIIIVNSGSHQNRPRQVPLRVWLSEDGQNFFEVYASDRVQNEWHVNLPEPKKAKFVKVGRLPGAMNNVFHLSKILVYGKKLY